ncbi:MAG: SET domain-containing protein-lysine N-methyltransferase [Verrucomicrobia bacterium]|nr:SET domain-containing protein-lysine N-methyltransferase [Verrucomicrobiota bacterium]MBU6446287.1 SET domain-containing protein-lysine N-methyltransferase [Verrucomicrobiota bacterium]MDE3047660.1 SET domain-containing protein-lysine N-methyltransferase [Verrucomicrobiota bacterium]
MAKKSPPPQTKITFQNEEERLDILQRGLAAFKRGDIPHRAVELGEKYKQQIEVPVEPKVDIRFINEEVGHGVFAKTNIKKGQFIGEYTGTVRENTRIYFVPLNNYCYEYPIPDRLGRSFVIDATNGNFTRFINHSYQPNLQPHYAFLDGFYHCIFFALQDIQKGEQLCYDYGRNYWMLRKMPCDWS